MKDKDIKSRALRLTARMCCGTRLFEYSKPAFLGAVRKLPPFLVADAICSRRTHKSAGWRK